MRFQISKFDLLRGACVEFPQNDPGAAIRTLAKAVLKLVEAPPGTFRCEDVISAIAAFAGECILRQAGEFKFDDHDFVPGQPIFSLKVNDLLSGDRSKWAEIPDQSAFGVIRFILAKQPQDPFPENVFPDIGKIYEQFASERRQGVPKKRWGKAPLSIPPNHYPREDRPPLRAAFELRQTVGQKWLDDKITPQRIANVAQFALVMLLNQMRESIAPAIALALAFETMNAMAKTAPMLPKHMSQIQAGA
jgi:hypothetical protein